jgi:hypothetical protein
MASFSKRRSVLERIRMSEEPKVRAGLSEVEMKSNLERLAFGGDPRRLEAFLDEAET